MTHAQLTKTQFCNGTDGTKTVFITKVGLIEC